MNRIVNAVDVKPNFDKLKETWSLMLSKFFDSKGILKPEHSVIVNCPHCNSTQTQKPFLLNGFQHVECSNCETLYVTPRLKDSSIEELYSDEYYSEFYQNSMLPAFETRKEKIGKNKFKQVTALTNVKAGKVLDIGCGIGEVSDVFLDNGWETHVTEMNNRAYAWLQTRNYNEVFHGTFDDYSTTEKFDVIMAWGVVEHVLDPNQFLKKVKKLLKPGGIFVSEVPHGNCLLIDYARNTGKDPERILMGEQHIVLYSKLAYENIHINAGLRKVHLQTNGLDVSTILKINNEKLSETLILDIQQSIDEKLYGDLLRGFWSTVD